MLPLSPYHKIFYNEWKLDPHSCKYNIVFDQTVSFNLSVNRLRDALKRLIRENILFNCNVRIFANEMFFQEHSIPLNIELHSCNVNDETIYQFVTQPFDLENGTLYRFGVFEVSHGYRIVLVLHHLLIDFTSGANFPLLVSEYYNDDSYSNLLTISEQKRLFIEQNCKLEKQYFAGILCESKNFWAQQFHNKDGIELTFLEPQSNSMKLNTELSLSSIQEIIFHLKEEDFNLLKLVSRKYKTTPYWLTQNIFAVALNYYTSQENFIISYPVNVINSGLLSNGSCVNTTFVPYSFNKLTTILDLINATKSFHVSLKSNGFNHAHYPVNKLITSKNSYFLDVAFVQTGMKNIPFNFNNVKLFSINHQFYVDYIGGLVLEVEFGSNNANFRIKYDKSKFSHELLKNFIENYQRLISLIIHDLANDIIDKKLIDYQILSQTKYQQLIYDFNQTKRDYPHNKTLHELFVKHVEHTPEDIALVYDGYKFSYRELNERANQLANYLSTTYQINYEDKILLLLERNQDIIIAILAVLKIGAAYVPVDTSVAPRRLEQILVDSQTMLCLCHRTTFANYHELFCKVQVLILDEHTTINNLNYSEKSNPTSQVKPNNLAYIIYTSGTTGSPKGVMIEHVNAINTIWSFREYFGCEKQLKLTSLANYSFDAFVFEMWNSLLFGNVLHLLSENIRKDALLLSSYINNNSIEFIPYISTWLLDLLADIDYQSLIGLLCGGEILNLSVIKKWCSKYLVYNGYGPTETSMCNVLHKVNPELERQIIGKPLANSQLFVLNKYMQPLPIGAIGELYIAGDSVGRGYLNNPSLNEQKFVVNPFCDAERVNSRIYATGDLVRYCTDGNLEYIGRIDGQVKVKGHRVELDEILTNLSKYPLIQHAVVVVRKFVNEQEINKIVAYYIADYEIEAKKLKEYLRLYLPDYMLPSFFVRIDAIPVKNASGKLDVSQLPLPEIKTLVTKGWPQNHLEQIVCGAFAEVLYLDREYIGVDNDFYDLGGDSLATISLVIKLQNYFAITVANVYEYRTPRNIALKVTVANDYFCKQLDYVKQLFKDSQQYEYPNFKQLSSEYQQYIAKANNYRFNMAKKPLKNILLTGATGYLGSHVLYEFLNTTEYQLFLPVRADNDVCAMNRVCDNYYNYFEFDLLRFGSRITAFAADLSLENLGLEYHDYSKLASQIDSVIHCAALIKHYGDYVEFYRQNVQSTINLLELCKLTELKDFHYVSTYSILTEGYIPEQDHVFVDENFNLELFKGINNYYNKTKLLSEQEVMKYRETGISANIYRVGNLAINSENYCLPSSSNSNRFISSIKVFVKLGFGCAELSNAEISPVNITARGICRIFEQVELSNQTYHLFCPDNYSLQDTLRNLGVKILPIKDFINSIEIILTSGQDDNLVQLVEQFLLHQGWLGELSQTKTKTFVINQHTNHILNQLNVVWHEIDEQIINHLLTN